MVVIGSAIVVVVIALASARIAKPEVTIPTAAVTRGEFIKYIQVRGEVKALKSLTINAPSDAGDLQILKLAKDGTMVKKGDPVVQFDNSKLEQTMAEDRTAVSSAQAQIDQSQAQARLKEEKDLTDLMKAKYDLESAKLDASKQEIVSKIEGEEANLKVADAEQKYHQADETLKADKASDAADLQDNKQKRDKALFDLQKTQLRIREMTLLAPGNGMVNLLMNWRAGNGPFGNGRPFREGDTAWSGAAVAELPDLSTLAVEARVDETDRGTISVGQSASVRVDAVPDTEFHSKLASISTLATPDYTAWPFPKNFTFEVAFDKPDTRLRPGMSATVRIAVSHQPDSILIPAKASFQKHGQTVAYVLSGGGFDEHTIEVAGRSDDTLWVTRGLGVGERVALEDPTLKR